MAPRTTRESRTLALEWEPIGFYSLNIVHPYLFLLLLLNSSRVKAPIEKTAGIQHNTFKLSQACPDYQRASSKNATTDSCHLNCYPAPASTLVRRNTQASIAVAQEANIPSSALGCLRKRRVTWVFPLECTFYLHQSPHHTHIPSHTRTRLLIQQKRWEWACIIYSKSLSPEVAI